MSESESDVSFGDAATTPGRWSISRIKLLIKLRLEMEAQFRCGSGRSRHLLWPQIYNKMKSQDRSMTETLKNVQKKYNNLMLTYKRIKSTSRGNNPPKWEFFDDFNEGLSQYSEIQDEEDQTNVRYIKVEKLDDDSVSFSSDDCDTRPVQPVYKNIVTYKQEPESNIIVTDNDQAENGIEVERIVENIPETKKRKLPQIGNRTPVQKKIKNSLDEPTPTASDDNSWFREYVKMNERKEQLRHDSLMEMERKKLEIETKKIQMMRELIDVMKKFVNK